MTPSELLAECRKLDIRFTTDRDGGLKVNAPNGVLVPGLLVRLKQHKAAILALIEAEQVKADAEFWRDAVKVFNRRARFVAANGDTTPRPAGACPRCGSTDWRDVPIHEGRSIRRDCGKCRHFIAFVKWCDVERFQAIESN